MLLGSFLRSETHGQFSLQNIFDQCFPQQFSSVQSLSCVRLFATPWTAAHQASLSITNSRSLLKLMSIESVMPSSHLIICCPLLLLPSIFPSIRVFPVSQLFISGGQNIGVSASASVLPMNIQGWFPLKWTGLISLLSKLYWRWFTNINVLFDFWVVHKQRYWEEIIITVIFL